MHNCEIFALIAIVTCLAGVAPPVAAQDGVPVEEPLPAAPPKAPATGAAQNPDGSWSYVYTLPADASSLYPDASWLPQPYAQDYPHLAATIEHFTRQSLERGGLDGVTVSVSLADGKPLVTLSGPDRDALAAFATAHQAFLAASHAPQGLAGVTLCQATSGCWDPIPVADQPWAFFLPLGLPLVGQQAVTFLNYPPDDSLTERDYLDNFTMERWYAVLQSEGIAAPYLYETIVDARPIAASGSSSTASTLPDITTYFNAPGTGHYYVTPMIEMLATPPALTGSGARPTTLPVIVLGTPARDAWATIVGQKSVGILEVGTTTLPGAAKPTAWVASNHPDVTTYQCCPGDPNPNCCDGDDCSYDLVPDDEIDLQAACIVQGLAEDPSADPAAVKASCAALWSTDPPPANQQTICIRAKLDYDYTTSGQCPSQQAAEAFCAAYGNDACPEGVYTCDLPN
jgi:hypothetical protein